MFVTLSINGTQKNTIVYLYAQYHYLLRLESIFIIALVNVIVLNVMAPVQITRNQRLKALRQDTVTSSHVITVFKQLNSRNQSIME